MKHNYENFNLESQVQKELDDFFETKIIIGGANGRKNKGYKYNQSDTLNLVEFVGASKFEKGDKDSESQDKIYLNSSVFRADVAAKQIDIDVKDIGIIPEDSMSDVPCIIARKKFKDWAKEIGLGIDLNTMVEAFPFYGSLVVKERGKEFDILDLSKLRNQQDAKSLNDAAYVIIEHTMKPWEMQLMPDWDLSNLECSWDEDVTVYERYGRVPKQYFDANAEANESVDTVSYVVLEKKTKGKDPEGCVLFIEEITKRPFKECHWKKRNGRWLGVGVIEENFENQKARNAVFHMRMRSTLWSSKNVFQTTDESIAKNLVTEVRDGEVLQLSTANGQISQVNTQNKALADYNATDDVVEKNSDQKSFTYEVATGEQMQSGTPFRLGVLLSNSVNSYFALKREKLALMLKELLYDYVFPSFEKELKKETIEYLFSGVDGYEELIDLVANAKLSEYIKNTVFKEERVPELTEQAAYRDAVKALRGVDIQIFKDSFKDIKYKIDIVITGESVNLQTKIETLTNLYTSLAQVGDPRASKILAKIATLTGEKLPPIDTTAQQVQPNQQLLGAITTAGRETNPNAQPQ